MAELVEHLVRCMEAAGLEIEAAGAPGYRKPGHIKGGFLRSKLRPDVVARDGRRAIFGVAVSSPEECVREQLEVLAGKCRTVVICVSAEAAGPAVDDLLQDAGKPHWRKMRLLRHPQTQWQEMPRRRPTGATINPAITVVVQAA
jgi:hypothetical protein